MILPAAPMPAAKAAITAGSVVTAIPGITAAAMPAEAMVAAGAEVTAAGVVAIEARPLLSFHLTRKHFRFIPV
jgi:hypothetical protein